MPGKYTQNGFDCYPKDKVGEFYAEFDEDVSDWCVFGSETGFCYATFCSKEEADKKADRMNEAHND